MLLRQVWVYVHMKDFSEVFEYLVEGNGGTFYVVRESPEEVGHDVTY